MNPEDNLSVQTKISNKTTSTSTTKSTNSSRKSRIQKQSDIIQQKNVEMDEQSELTSIKLQSDTSKQIRNKKKKERKYIKDNLILPQYFNEVQDMSLSGNSDNSDNNCIDENLNNDVILEINEMINDNQITEDKNKNKSIKKQKTLNKKKENQQKSSIKDINEKLSKGELLKQDLRLYHLESQLQRVVFWKYKTKFQKVRCADCYPMVCLASFQLSCFLHQGICLNTIKSLVYLLLLPIRLMYFFYRWTIDQIIYPIYVAWCIYGGKKFHVDADSDTFPCCCLSFNCCKTCCPCCAYDNVCLCLDEDKTAECSSECWLDVDICCLQNCTFLGCGTHCQTMSKCCQYSAMCLIQCCASFFKIFGDWCGDTIESYCTVICEACTCIYGFVRNPTGVQ